MARDIYAHVPPFGEAKVWSDEKQPGQTHPEIGIGTEPTFGIKQTVVTQVCLHGWYSKEDLIKILARKEMQ